MVRPSLLPTLMSIALVTLLVTPSWAQVDEPADTLPPDAVVARFGIEAGSLAGVSNSAELVAALREHLVVDAALPLDESFAIALRGYAGHTGSGTPYAFVLSSLGMRREAGTEPLVGFPYVDAVRESHGEDFPSDGDEWDEIDSEEEWKEEEAWAGLVTALDVGLPQSTDAYARAADGHVPLRVVAVYEVAWDDYETEESIDGGVLKLVPEVFFSSQFDVELEEDLRGLVIELAPGAT